MSKSQHYPPELGGEQYHCPHCNVYSKQFWAHLEASGGFQWSSFVDQKAKFNEFLGHEWSVSKCEHCGDYVIWQDSAIVYPKKVVVELPNEDLDDEIKRDYMEAARILSDSPRAAAALLRLGLQKLCRQLGEDGKNINDDIKKLVIKGLNPLVQKSLDALRITGNNAVHPGEINLDENPERVIRLFELLNFIANKMISEPKEIEAFYEELPENAKSAVSKRDAATDRK